MPVLKRLILFRIPRSGMTQVCQNGRTAVPRISEITSAGNSRDHAVEVYFADAVVIRIRKIQSSCSIHSQTAIVYKIWGSGLQG